MKVYYLGTCSGTEPMPYMHHTSYVIEVNKSLYWFDAGENSSHRAYTSGLDFLASRAVFISHAHVDHIGGLPNLIFVFHKLNAIYKTPLYNNNTLDLYLPDGSYFEVVKKLGVGYRGSGSKINFNINERVICDGVIYEDENVKVSAYHNKHLGECDETGWHSFSFVLEAEGKRIVCSGDVKDYSELDALPISECDLLIGETGHHKVSRVLDYATENKVKKMRFIHHGREILGDRAAAEKTLAEHSQKTGLDAKICYDGMVEEL